MSHLALDCLTKDGIDTKDNQCFSLTSFKCQHSPLEVINFCVRAYSPQCMPTPSVVVGVMQSHSKLICCVAPKCQGACSPNPHSFCCVAMGVMQWCPMQRHPHTSALAMGQWIAHSTLLPQSPCCASERVDKAVFGGVWYRTVHHSALLIENGYFDASFTCLFVDMHILGIWYTCILTQFHPFSSIFCSFPPHPLLTRLISPHHGDPEKAGVMWLH